MEDETRRPHPEPPPAGDDDEETGRPGDRDRRRFRVWRSLTATYPRRIAVLVLALMMFTGGSALAAWIVYSGGHGTSTGSFATATTNDAITVMNDTFNTNVPISGPGGTGTMYLKLVNNTASTSEAITGVSYVITTTPSDCASHLTIPNATTKLTGVPAFGGGMFAYVSVTPTADATLPNDCSAGSYSVAWTLTTNP